MSRVLHVSKLQRYHVGYGKAASRCYTRSVKWHHSCCVVFFYTNEHGNSWITCSVCVCVCVNVLRFSFLVSYGSFPFTHRKFGRAGLFVRDGVLWSFAIWKADYGASLRKGKQWWHSGRLKCIYFLLECSYSVEHVGTTCEGPVHFFTFRVWQLL